ncbi:MAG: hypothetical protein ABIO70_04140 [Pseudomonadota bacterium]
MPSPSTLWKLVAAALFGHVVLLLAHGGRPARDPVWALLPILPLTGASLDADLAASGLLLPEGPTAEGPESFGTNLGERLGKTAYLGPTMSVDDFSRGLVALHQGAGPGLRDEQIGELRETLQRLGQIRDELNRSDAPLLQAARAVACARDRALASLTEDQKATLLAPPATPEPPAPDGAPGVHP